jgi:hypothetical protein
MEGRVFSIPCGGNWSRDIENALRSRARELGVWEYPRDIKIKAPIQYHGRVLPKL